MSGAGEGRGRVIGGAGALTLVVGSMLGVGIFLAPPVVAGHVASPALFLALWVVGGVVALAGAVACAELGTLLPRSGGDYVFQRAAFGPATAFASGWVLFAAIFAGSIAALSVALVQYQLPVLLGADLTRPLLPGLGVTLREVVAAGIVLAFTAVSLTGARLSAAVQTAMTVLPLLAFLALAVAALVLVEPAAPRPPVAAAPSLDAGGLARSYNAVYFAYSGWINVIYVAGEVRRPERSLPRALIGGTLVVTALYLVICVAFVTRLGMVDLAQAGEAGSALAERVGEFWARWLLTACIAAALLASVNATVLGGARILRAMAADGAAARWLAAEARPGVPARALWVQAAWSVALVLSGGFDALLQMVSVAMVLTGSLTVGSLFVLRRREPAAPRPYRATGYPWLPALYLVASLALVVVMLATSLARDPPELLPLLGLAVLGVAYAVARVGVGRAAGS